MSDRVEVEFVGGLRDGLKSTRTQLPPFGWPDKAGRLLRRGPCAGAPTLYRRGKKRRSGVVVYEAAPGWRPCPGCGVLHGPADCCSLCGSELKAAA